MRLENHDISWHQKWSVEIATHSDSSFIVANLSHTLTMRLSPPYTVRLNLFWSDRPSDSLLSGLDSVRPSMP